MQKKVLKSLKKRISKTQNISMKHWLNFFYLLIKNLKYNYCVFINKYNVFHRIQKEDLKPNSTPNPSNKFESKNEGTDKISKADVSIFFSGNLQLVYVKNIE